MKRYNISKEELDDLSNNIQNVQKEEEMLGEKNNSEEFELKLIELIAKKRGAILTKNEIDYEKVANIILTDFRNGNLGKITLEKV